MLFCAGVAFAGEAPFAPSLHEEPVREVFVEGLSSIKNEELLYLLDIKQGEKIEPLRLRRGIKRVFLKGIFEFISVERDDSDRAVVRVKVREKDFISAVSVRGNEHLSDKFLKGRLMLKKNGIMRYDLMDEAEAALKSAIEEKGFPEVGVRLGVEKTGKPYRVNIVVDVKEGRPLLIQGIDISGRPQPEVLSRMSLGAGDIYDQFVLKDDIESLKEFYLNAGYLNPSVGPYSFESGRLKLNVNAGKKLTIELRGNSSVGSKRLLEAMPFRDAKELRDDLVEEAVSGMAAIYHEKGFPFVQIAPVISSADDELRLVFYIFEDGIVTVNSLKFSGTNISDKSLREIITLKEGGIYNPDALDGDVDSLKEFYISLGYLYAAVSEPRVDIKDLKADIIIDIDEGAKFIISGVEIRGVKALPLEDVRKALGLKEGNPYNEIDIFDARYRVLELYFGNGFARCKIDIKRDFEGNGVNVIFDIIEGNIITAGKTILIGNRTTKPEVIRREFIHSEGLPLKGKSLSVERQRLYALGLFSDVAISALEKYDDTVDVAVRVKEGKAGAVEFGLGYAEYERYRGFLDIGYRNLFGLNRHGSFRIDLSSVEKRYMVNYYEPWFIGKRIQMKSFIMHEDRKERNIDTGEIRYRLRRNTASLGVFKSIGDRLRADVSYEFSVVKTFDVQPDVILSREDTGSVAISGIKSGLIYDSRDNPPDPRKGVFAGVSAKLASDVFLSESDFLKVIVQGNAYRELTRRLVLAGSLRVGVAVGFNETRELPIVERFFLGGRNTVRGYAQDALGPRGYEGTPTGGNAFLLGNIELRTYAGRGWGVVTFLDFGNVWDTIESIEPAELKYTMGLGIRYDTPVGPLRVDYGYKLEREADEPRSEIHFSIGHAF